MHSQSAGCWLAQAEARADELGDAKSATDAAEEMQRRLQEAEDDLVAEKRRSKRAASECDRAEADLSEAKKRARAEEERAAAAEAEVAELRRQLASMRTGSSSGSTHWKQEFAKLVEEAEALRAERDTLMRSLNTARGRMGEQEREVADLRVALEEIRAQLQSALSASSGGTFGEFAKTREDNMMMAAELDKLRRVHGLALRHRMGDRTAAEQLAAAAAALDVGMAGAERERASQRRAAASALATAAGHGRLAAAGAAALGGGGDGTYLDGLAGRGEWRGRAHSPVHAFREEEDAGYGGVRRGGGRAGAQARWRSDGHSRADGPRSARSRAGNGGGHAGGGGGSLDPALGSRPGAGPRLRGKPTTNPTGAGYQPRALAFNKARAKQLRGLPEPLRRVVDSEANSRIYIDLGSKPKVRGVTGTHWQ